MRTANPVLTDNTFSIRATTQTDAMTMSGVVGKTAILLLLTLLSAGWVWVKFFKSTPALAAESAAPWMMGGLIGGFILALFTAFKPTWAPLTAPVYALFEGLFLGGASALLEQSFPGIVVQATTLTFGTLFAMLAVYQSGWIQATEKFKIGIVAATGAIAIVYLVALALSYFGGIQLSFIYGNSWVGIGFSLVVIAIAAMNFILDFDFIEQGVRRGTPKYMEWYAGFALMVTLVWLYIEFLRLLSKVRSRE